MTDIDISEEILVKAKAKIAEGALPHVKESHVMDACDMAFPDASFDVVSLPFVIPLIPDADRLLSECARVLRSRGEIIIVSKITTSEGAMRRVEQLVSPLVQNIGLSSAFRLDGVQEWLNRHPSFRLVENRPISPAGHFRLLQLPARERLQGGAALYACVRQPSCRWAIPSCEGQQHGQGKWPTML
ncbi:class I SAM-dependent methyltransferase [Agrobacterium tumefaciens]|uniref:class I SAM-dependent methyltransferase n=1 Tax=Agrobacterium TaxID=357 RepID=UPI000FDD7C76|nr:class I SAM-dependent methyltransferase [Agrobacterium sp. RS6]NTZ63755.1 class I SAM-dependent methyltransferase [Agrobacterium tumefaciens]